MKSRVPLVAAAVALALCAAAPAPKLVPLPTSKAIPAAAPGDPVATNGGAAAIAVSPDGRYVAVLNAGYGDLDLGRRQSIALLDRTTGQVVEVPDDRLAVGAANTYFLGLAFSADGRHLYASMASRTDPTGATAGHPGDGVAVYALTDGKLAPERFLAIPPRGDHPFYAAQLAVLPGDRLLVAGDLSDEAVLLDGAGGTVVSRFELGDQNVPALYPYGAIASADGKTGWISLWNGSAVDEIDLSTGAVRRRIALLAPSLATSPGSHPTAMALSPDGRRLYVALANADAVAVVDTSSGTVTSTWSTKLPGETYGGSTPNALALSADGATLYVADGGANAVAVIATADGHAKGFLPTQWYPTALAVAGDDLYVATSKGVGTGPNGMKSPEGIQRAHPYIAWLLKGSIARVHLPDALPDLDRWTSVARQAAGVDAKAAKIRWAGRKNPIRHVVYVIRENRTYDQILGDLGVGNGDPSLTMYGAAVTPNAHALARAYGVYDSFLCSGEVSGDGHLWTDAAITTDYNEKTWPIGYRSDERVYDYGGTDDDRVMMDLGLPDVDEAATGNLWTNAEAHHVTHRNYGEFVLTHWCDQPEHAASGVGGTPLTDAPAACPEPFVQPGGKLADGTPSPFPWPVPIPAADQPTQPALVGHFDPKYAEFRMDYPDQLRADEFLRELGEWTAGRAGGRDDMPALVVLQLPNDHTAGTSPGMPTPKASVADNDLAVGRVIDAISHGPYWDDTAIFVVEDDAQDGADHVDAHRAPVLVVSKYAPVGPRPVVDSTLYTSVSVVHTIEVLLGLPPMNDNDARAPILAAAFEGPGTAPPFTADASNRANGLIYTANTADAPDGTASLELDLSRPDAADTVVLNEILWRDAFGDRPMPPPRHLY